MTDFVEPFELRRLVVRFQRTPSGGVAEDLDAITFHLAKITGGAIDAAWTAANYAACEARVDTWWATVKTEYVSTTRLFEYRWYKDGPVFAPADRADGPPNPAERITARSVVGTRADAQQCPPQVAMTITENVSVGKRRGRFYLPAPGITSLDADGRIAIAFRDVYLSFSVAMYNGWRADGFKPVVFSRGRSSHLDSHGGTIPTHAATAYEVVSLQMDNLFDVMRSRRYSLPTNRSVTVLT
jgi:hypothetical protein